MTELKVHIPDRKLPFFLLLAEEMGFVVVEKHKTTRKLSTKQKTWVEDLKTALHEVDLHTQGKLQLKSAEQLLNEL
jgi:hypothetical protein